ncbi:MAG: hypothetical protein GF401_19535 [Chitinivibrionales bacterium]|nr:hypothetical protein [Chitinivibrionales bacterium]
MELKKVIAAIALIALILLLSLVRAENIAEMPIHENSVPCKTVSHWEKIGDVFK